MHVMDSRIVMNGCGCVYNDNDQEPIDIRFALPLSGREFPQKKRLTVGNEWVRVDPGDVPAPHYVVITNTTGAEHETYPDAAEAERIARCIVLVAFDDKVPRLWLHAAKAGEEPMGGVAALQMIDGEKVWIRSQHIGTECQVRYMVAG